MSDKVTWDGTEFSVLKHNANWKDTGGIYIFCGVNKKNEWTPLYIGQTDSFLNRLPSHDRWNDARNLGATHVHAKAVSQQASRDKLEADLIQSFQPSLNTQLK
jgi:excinuclease UvrABC nuclease subunit